MFSKLFCFSKKAVSSDNTIIKPQVVVVQEQTTVAHVREQFPPKIIQYAETQPFIVPITTGQVVKVYDGDTFTLAGYLPYDESPLYRFAVRLNGIDCPEIKGKTDDEKRCAVLARAELTNMIMNKKVVLKNVGNEKYGRLLADVYINGVHVNQHMLDVKLAVPYGGGTKKDIDWSAKYDERVSELWSE
jgi:micrococcal nuclease